MPSRQPSRRSRQPRAAPEAPITPDHGEHTLRVWSGTVVGKNGDDVFVELGPRMQGVLSRQRFSEEPALGEVFDFTLLGQEDGLWAVARVEERLIDSWSQMECGSWVQARVTGKNPGGLELKMGPLHGFMPRSQTGLPRDRDPGVLIGTEILCEVIEVDVERQRVLLSRKNVERKQRESSEQRRVGSLKPGQVIHGRVSRLEAYGAFVRFGHGLEGLIHISDLAAERVSHPSAVLELGQTVEAKVLTIRRGGKRIGLGLKQMSESPWRALERTHYVDQVVEGRVTRVVGYGAFVSVVRGVEGLLHISECGLGEGRRLTDLLRPGQPIPVRILALDLEAERLSLSRLHRNGALVSAEDALGPEELELLGQGGVLGAGAESPLEPPLEQDPSQRPAASTNLGQLLDRALKPGSEPGAQDANSAGG